MLAIWLIWRNLSRRVLREAMAHPTQQDLFGNSEPQSELFGTDEAPPAYQPNLDEVRDRLNRILAEMRGAEKLPWDADKTLLYRTIFPHMTGWLPEEEGTQLRFQFEAEMDRLKAA